MSSLRNVFIEKMNLAAGHDKAAFEMSLINDYGALPMIIDQTAVPIAYTLQLPPSLQSEKAHISKCDLQIAFYRYNIDTLRSLIKYMPVWFINCSLDGQSLKNKEKI